MMGEKIGEERGRITGTRVLACEGAGMKIETSFQTSGTVLGSESRNTGTYWSVARPDGTIYGEGQGIVTGRNGESMTWKGQGVGQPKPDGAVSFRGSLYYSAQTPNWTRLNKVAVMFHWDVDKDGGAHSEFYEWK